MEFLTDPVFWLIMPASFAFVTFAIVWHELGHMAAGYLVGAPLRELSFGGGPPWVDQEFGAFRFTLRRFTAPLGLVKTYSMILNSNRDFLAFIAGGPLANLAAGALFLTAFTFLDDPLAAALVSGAGSTQLFVGLGALWPRRRKNRYGQLLKSDGAQLWERLHSGEARLREARARVQAAIRAHAPPGVEPVLSRATMRAVAVSLEKRFADATQAERQLQLWRREFARDHDETERRFMTYGLLMRMIFRAAPFDHERIDAFSRELIDADPQRPLYMITCALALSILGREDEAVEALSGFSGSDGADGEFSFVGCLYFARRRLALGQAQEALAMLEPVAKMIARLPDYEQSDTWEVIVNLRARAAALPGGAAIEPAAAQPA